MTRDVGQLVSRVPGQADEDNFDMDRQVDAALDRAFVRGRFDATLFTADQLTLGVHDMRESANVSNNLLAHFGFA